MLICTDDQINNLSRYIKSSNSDPERAMVLALILYWGLSGPELRCSTIEIIDGLIQIQLYRRKLSYGHKNYQRVEILKLPSNPNWIRDLQKRFITQWEDKYKRAQKSFPCQLLLLTKNLSSNRPIGVEALRVIIYKGTLEATNEKIPPSVLRRTSGHIYSQIGEVSI